MEQNNFDLESWKRYKEMKEIYGDELGRRSSLYFNNLSEIESQWKELKKNGFRQWDRDQFWKLCNNGRLLYWEWISLEKQVDSGFFPPPSVPAFQRAVMLLEHEKRWKSAIQLCKEALKWIDNDWYQKKTKTFIKKIEKEEKLSNS